MSELINPILRIGLERMLFEELPSGLIDGRGVGRVIVPGFL